MLEKVMEAALEVQLRTPLGDEVNQADLEQLYDDHGAQMFVCAVAVTRCRDLAEDAVQEGFCRLVNIKARPANLKSYAFRTVRNAAIDLMRKRNMKTEPITESVYDLSAGPRESAEVAEQKRMISDALNTLGTNERETIVQHLYGELTFREISEVTEVSMGTVTSWYRRGMQKLRSRLENDDG